MRLVYPAIFHGTTNKPRFLFVANFLLLGEAVPYLFDQEDKLTSVFILWKQYLDNVFLVGKRRRFEKNIYSDNILISFQYFFLTGNKVQIFVSNVKF